MPFTVLNGRLPDSLLTGLPWAEAAGFRLRIDAAASAGRLAAAFYTRFAAPLLLTDAYRTFVSQVELKARKGVWAATPGTSNHGLGIAIDFASGINVDGSVQHRWMVANAALYGWVNPSWATNWNPLDGQHEPWHWEYHPELDTTPAPAPTDWTDMATQAEIEALFRKVLAEDRVTERADMLEQAGKANTAVLAAVQAASADIRAASADVPAVTVRRLLATKPEDGFSTVWQTLRDARTISRRLEVAWRKFVNLPPV